MPDQKEAILIARASQYEIALIDEPMLAAIGKTATLGDTWSRHRGRLLLALQQPIGLPTFLSPPPPPPVETALTVHRRTTPPPTQP